MYLTFLWEHRLKLEKSTSPKESIPWKTVEWEENPRVFSTMLSRCRNPSERIQYADSRARHYRERQSKLPLANRWQRRTPTTVALIICELRYMNHSTNTPFA
jgi:hypothetical protein